MTLTHAQDLFREALTGAGWRLMGDLPLSDSRARNPTQLLIRRSRVERSLLVYAWNISSEGKGRRKAGRDDLDWRVQTTRSHEGDLLVPPACLAVGLGWFEEREVFGAFDVWVKRTTGRSSSVHLSDALLSTAAQESWAEDLRRDGPTCSFRAQLVDRYFAWLHKRLATRFIAVDPLEFLHDGRDRMRLRMDPRKDWRYSDLRRDDYVVLRRDGRLLDRSVWCVDRVETDRQVSSGGSNRPYLGLHCRRHGVVRDDARMQREA